MFTPIIAHKVISFIKNPYVIGALMVMGGILYHFYKVNSLKNEVLRKQQEVVGITTKYETVLRVNKDNASAIVSMENNIIAIKESCSIAINAKNNTIGSLNALLNDNRKVRYQHTYSYEKCQFKINGDNNESSELYKILNSIGK